MADKVTVSNSPGADYTVLTDEVTDAALGTGQTQYLKIMDGTVDGTTKAVVDAKGLHVVDQAVLSALEEMRVSSEQLEGQPLQRSQDTVSATLATDAIMVGDRPIDVQYAFANVAASTTDGLLVGAPPSKRIRVLVFRLHAGTTATNVTFNTRRSTAAGVACSETFATSANGGHHGAFSPVGHFQTNFNEDLTVTTGAGSTVGIGLVYAAI